MKALFLEKILPLLLILLLLVLGIVIVKQRIEIRHKNADLISVQNQLSEAIGTVEEKNGLYVHLASEYSNLNRRYDEILGENERISEVLNRKEEEIRVLSQMNASLRNPVVFTGRATTTVVAGGCDTIEQTPQTGTVVTTETDSEPDSIVPNLRVAFSLEDSGFRVDGFTESNPSLTLGQPIGHAELTLTQIEPFSIDLAVSENEQHEWRAIIYEQSSRLEFNIDSLSVSPQKDRLRFVERIGFGARTNVTDESAGVAPVISFRLGHSGALSVDGGPYWDLTDGISTTGATVGVTVYPFDRGRK